MDPDRSTEADLFAAARAGERSAQAPLAERLRPRTLDDLQGQEHLLGPAGPLRRLIESDRLPSLILWGPPGTGKTTLARIIAERTGRRFEALSATSAGIKDAKAVFERAREAWRYEGRGCICFVDEIHRFNKGQQDAFLPQVEDGTVVLIGATTENPSFEVNSALLSRCEVFVLRALDEEALGRIVDRAAGPAGASLRLAPDARAALIRGAGGDARRALNLLERAAALAGETGTLSAADVQRAAGERTHLYDRQSDAHYDHISALHKSLRGSDPQAAVYWLMRMIEAGEDPVYLARRMLRFASEDVGNADPQALVLGGAVLQAVQLIGLPEADTALVQLAVYLATAPKSNACYLAAGEARRDVREMGDLPVPLHLRNAPTALMKDLGYGRGYEYAHEHVEAITGQTHLPPECAQRSYYRPVERGFEREIAKRMAYWDGLRQKRRESPS